MFAYGRIPTVAECGGGALSAQIWKRSVLGQDPRPLASGDVGMFAAMFDGHAAHVFDYCKAILAGDDEAARATEATFITAHARIRQLRDHDRLRAWLFALARNECTSRDPGRAVLAAHRALSGRMGDIDHPDDLAGIYVAEPDTEDLRLAAIEAHARLLERVQAAGSLVQDPRREAAALVYRHRIELPEVSAILGISAEQAEAVLSAALAGYAPAYDGVDETMIGLTALGEEFAAPGPSSEAVDAAYAEAVALPLAVLPPDVWRRAARVAMDPEFREYRDAVAERAGRFRFDGFPANSAASLTQARKRLRLATVVMVPLAAAGVVILFVGHSPSSAGGSGNVGNSQSAIAADPGQPSTAPTPHVPSSELFPKKKGKGGSAPQPVLTLAPQPSPNPSASKSHKPAPSPTTRISPSSTPFPSSSSPTSTPTSTPTPTPTVTPTPTSS
jgi:DNA-directed RNA polymerase specialized sigma24 family protein